MPCPNSARERSGTIGFRVTPEQARHIDLMARASDMTKQNYLYRRALEEEVVIRPDVHVCKMLRDEMARVPGAQAHTVRRRSRRGLAWTLDFLAREFSAMRGEEEPSDAERKDALIFSMSRR